MDSLIPQETDLSQIHLLNEKADGLSASVDGLKKALDLEEAIRKMLEAENQQLRQRIAQLMEENARLQAQRTPAEATLFRTDRYPLEQCETALAEAIRCAKSKQSALANIVSGTGLVYFNCSQFGHQELAQILNRHQHRYRFTKDDVDKAYAH